MDNNLNTSHVKVKHIPIATPRYKQHYLNTSHVKVKRDLIRWNNDIQDLFKYISC